MDDRIEPRTWDNGLTYEGSLDSYTFIDLTPSIGREFPDARLVELISSENADTILRDLAITLSHRCVVFFRAQHDFTPGLQKDLTQKLGQLSGKPSTSGLQIHKVYTEGPVNDHGEMNTDPYVSIISSEAYKKLSSVRYLPREIFAGDNWHTDGTYEKTTVDYTILKVHTLPRTGGDTLFASGYDIYDRLSPVFQAFADGLLATYASAYQKPTKEGSSSHNSHNALEAVHPVVRTHPITGWKSLYAAGRGSVRRINDVTDRESELLLEHFSDLLIRNHDLQVRFKWGKNDVAIWDNRCTFHTATFDYDEPRVGTRTVGIGERPFLHPASKSKKASRMVSGTVQR